MQLANAAIDVSDGLLADVNHMCEASDLMATIDVNALPYSAELIQSTTLAQRQQWALTGGDDYQLCFTVKKQHWQELQRIFQREKYTLFAIGTLAEGKGIQLTGDVCCSPHQLG